MLYDIALYYDWNILLIWGNEDKNPYRFGNTTNQTFNLEEDDEYYIITLNTPEQKSESYYINKKNYLLEMSTHKSSYTNDTYYYNNTEEDITIPEEILNNAQPELIPS